MDYGTIIGIGAGLMLIVMGIVTAGGNLANYLNLPSVLIVIFGSFSAMIVANPLTRMLGIMRYVRNAVRVPDWQEQRIIEELVRFADKARKEGLLALEDDLETIEDEFMRKGIRLVVDGTDPEIIKNILYNDLGQLQERHETGIKIFDDWGKIAPAFGMIGTLAGLIAMLADLGGDESAIGSGMALALITTMYGAIFANLVLIPVRSKLEGHDKAETRAKEIIVEGVLSIQSGDNPRTLGEKLVAFLPPAERSGLQSELE
ncbi:MAG: motility protein A [Spirochaetaceae bacterium]